ncbi:Sensor histidine kinase RcsC [Asticcacaulis sp. MM231]|uniref:PAS domain-containing protein n=1 Tax=Asticcacaulis sp. MM231 TaxID=3157666 RepID=UPI0032D587A7
MTDTPAAHFIESLRNDSGETGRLIADYDWASTAMGSIETWSPSLRTATGMVLRSPLPIVMLWGEDGFMLYNDAYSVFAGGRHPWLLGSPVRLGWPEVADFNDNVMKVCLAGGTLAYTDQELTLLRNGKPEQVWMNLDYSPVPDETGKPAGVIAIVNETTQRIQAERQARAERERQQAMLQQMPGFVAVVSGPDNVYEYVNDAYVRIAERHGEFIGQRFRDVFPELADQGYFELLDQVYTTGERRIASGMELRLHGGDVIQYIDFVFEPIRNAHHDVTGIFMGGYEVTDGKRADMRREALLRLTDEIRDLEDPAEIAFVASRVLGEALVVSRAGYGVIDREDETITIERDWNAPGIKSLAGVLKFRDYGSYIEDLKRGDTVVFADAEKDPRTQANAAALKAISAQSVVNMPVTEHGRFVALLYLNHETARKWTENDLALIKEVAERTRTATERARVAVELRRSEAALRELNANLEREVIERTRERGRTWAVSPDLLSVLRTDGRFESANPAWSKVLGWSEAQIILTPFVDFLHPDDVEASHDAFEIAKSGSPVLRFENRYRHADGGWRWLSWVAVPIDGKVYCSARDITEEKAAEAERERLWTLSTDMLARADYSGDMNAVNPAWTEILGWSEQELLTNPYVDIIHPDDVPVTVAALAEMGATGQPTRFQNLILSKSGEWKPIDWTVAPEPDGLHFIAVGRDLTEDKARERQLQQAQDALRQAQKMEAVGQLTGGIAHDFNNMLAVVMGSLDLLNRRLGPEDPRAKRYVEAAMEGAKRAASLTQRLLAFSRQQPLRPELIDANKLVSGMSDLLRHSIGADIRLETVLSGGLWRVSADPNQLESVILNLGVNARDAMPGGGKLTIETQNAHLDTRYVASEMGVPAGQYVLIAITDTGEGMPPEIIAKAFDPFFTTKAVGKGTGLGLSQVYGFVKQSGGHVKIYSEVGQGTSVKIYLPRSHERDETEVAEADTVLLMGEEREVILVVDDEPAVRQFSCDALSELGYRVLEADSAATALVLLQANPDISLLFTDIVMPDTNGRKLADAAQAIRPDLKVLYTTGYTRNAVVHNGIVDKGVQLIGKPFTIDELAARVRDLLDC